jgi:phenylacetic acid degradation operon negative regulatory protein
LRQVKISPVIQAQPIIFNLLGDYVYPFGDRVWTSGLLDALRVVEVGERAARSALSRMKQNGWLRSHRDGRRSAYTLTAKMKTLLEEGTRRLFGPRPRDWDGCWNLVVYSLPQELRTVRRLLRTRLSWLGYGMLLPGTMVAAFPRREEITALIRELQVEPYVHFFSSASLETAGGYEVISRCWDLQELDRRYTRFVDRYRPSYKAFTSRKGQGGDIPHEESFIHRLWITYEYSSFPQEDPNLPPELLPPAWSGAQAAELLMGYRALLKEAAEGYVRSIMQVETVS